MQKARSTSRKGRAAALPIFLLAALFLLVGAGLRFSGRIDDLKTEETERKESLGYGLRRSLHGALVRQSNPANSIEFRSDTKPVGSELFPPWQPQLKGPSPLPIAGEQALSLAESGRFDEAWAFFQHPSVLEVSAPNFSLERVKTIRARQGNEAARDELIKLNGKSIDDIEGLPFHLAAALLMSSLDEEIGRRMLLRVIEEALTRNGPHIPVEAAPALQDICERLGIERAPQLLLWQSMAEGVAWLRQEGALPKVGRPWELPYCLLLSRAETVLIRDKSNLNELIREVENEYRESGVLRAISRKSQVGSEAQELVLEPILDSEGAQLELLSFFLLACAAITGLLGGWSSMRIAKREARLSELKSDFVDLVSHELRTPLTILSLKTEMLATDSVPPEKQVSYLRDLDHEVAKLRDLVDGLLDFSRLEKGHMAVRDEELILRDLVAEVVSTVRRRHRSIGQKLRIEVPRGPWAIRGDFEALSRSLQNLLDNSAKYAGPAATVCLRVEVAEDKVRIKVSDDGPGVAPQLAPKIFDRFVRGHHSGIAGSGLGLALVQATALAHGGRLTMDQGRELGAEFTMELPRENVP